MHGISDAPLPAPVWKRDTYEALTAAIGEAPVTGIARRFHQDLGSRFPIDANRDGLQRDAHAIVSAAGMLGFVALSQSATALEQACVGDNDLTLPLAALMSARQATDRCLAGFLRGEPLIAPPAALP